jgi:UDP-N-acetylmuramate dehydrogenase
VIITAIDLILSLRPSSDISYPALLQYFSAHPSLEPTPRAVFDAVVSIRRDRLPDPAIEPNAGSFFKNPIIERSEAIRLQGKFPALPLYHQKDGRTKLAAAWMIEHCGWKGYRRDNFGVHGRHALVLVNYGNGSGEQLLHLASEIAASVYREFNVGLEIEPRLYGRPT